MSETDKDTDLKIIQSWFKWFATYGEYVQCLQVCS